MTSYAYAAYGLHFESAFPLPEMRPAAPRKPDVTISYGDVPEGLTERSAYGVAWQSSPGRLLLSVDEVARYLIIENREIRIHALPGSSEKDIRTFLLGSVLGALLHARQLLVLHASVIETDCGAVLFMGPSGAGKSTLLGSFLKRGYSMLADDKAGIALDKDGVPRAMPGLPLIRLTGEAVNRLQYPEHGAQPRHSFEKLLVPVEQFCAKPLRLHAAYSLHAHNRPDIELESLTTLDGFQLLNRHTYRRRFIHPMDKHRSHFPILSLAARHARVVVIARPEHPFLIEELTDRIEADMAR